MRRTIEVLSSSVDDPALATTRRTSFPERGLTMSPIAAGSVALFDKIGHGIGEMGEIAQPRTYIGSGPVGILPGKRPHLLLAAAATEDAYELERLGIEHKPDRTLADRPGVPTTGECDCAGGAFGEQILAQQIGHGGQARVYGSGLSVAYLAEGVANVVLVRADVEEELATP